MTTTRLAASEVGRASVDDCNTVSRHLKILDLPFEPVPGGISVDGEFMAHPPQFGAPELDRADAQLWAARYRQQADKLMRSNDAGQMLTLVGAGLSVIVAVLSGSSDEGVSTAMVLAGVLAVVLLGAFFGLNRKAEGYRQWADYFRQIATLWDEAAEQATG